ncbi:hypothetical protein V6N11_054545 [Hibiscus sabdariffa]|uniref:Uncharacterized protein n=1 Tax=Hibiscus sabdariffa TaxID=183260 RepID=A0ABR2S4S7_9ROSI
MANNLVNQGLPIENSEKTPGLEQLVHEQTHVADVSTKELVIIDRSRGCEPQVCRYLKRFIKDNNPSLVALLETRISGNKTDSVVRKLGFPNSFRVEARGFSGGIWLLWKDSISLEIEVISNQFIHYRLFSSCISMPVFATIVYVNLNIFYRKFLWKQLEVFNPRESAPWIIGGDFSSLLNEGDSMRGVRGRSGASCSFHDFTFRTGLIDEGF